MYIYIFFCFSMSVQIAEYLERYILIRYCGAWKGGKPLKWTLDDKKKNENFGARRI